MRGGRSTRRDGVRSPASETTPVGFKKKCPANAWNVGRAREKTGMHTIISDNAHLVQQRTREALALRAAHLLADDAGIVTAPISAIAGVAGLPIDATLEALDHRVIRIVNLSRARDGSRIGALRKFRNARPASRLDGLGAVSRTSSRPAGRRHADGRLPMRKHPLRQARAEASQLRTVPPIGRQERGRAGAKRTRWEGRPVSRWPTPACGVGRASDRKLGAPPDHPST